MPYRLEASLATLKLYWKSIAASYDGVELPKLALLLLDSKPHAADPERQSASWTGSTLLDASSCLERAQP